MKSGIEVYLFIVSNLLLTGLPKLTTPPLIVNITCDSFNLRWQTWRAEADIGDPPIGPYTSVN